MHDGRGLAALPFGVSEVDARLLGGGLTLGHLYDVIEDSSAGEYADLAAPFASSIIASKAVCCRLDTL